MLTLKHPVEVKVELVYGNWFSFLLMWIVGIKLKSSASIFLNEPSCKPLHGILQQEAWRKNYTRKRQNNVGMRIAAGMQQL